MHRSSRRSSLIPLTPYSPPPPTSESKRNESKRNGQIGSGFSGTLLSGKTHNDEFYVDENGRTRTRTNRSGGVQGGISNGETIVVRVVSGKRGRVGWCGLVIARSSCVEYNEVISLIVV